MIGSGPAVADDACTQNGVTLPECNYVTTPPIDEDTGWALYCPPQEPYHWSGYWSKQVTGGSQSDYSVTENLIDEAGNFAKGDYTITKWNLFTDATVTVTSGCTPVNPNGSCTGTGACNPDPGCPQSDQNSVCVGGGESKTCWNEWAETCVSGNTVNNYWCTTAEIIRTCCFGC